MLARYGAASEQTALFEAEASQGGFNNNLTENYEGKVAILSVSRCCTKKVCNQPTDEILTYVRIKPKINIIFNQQHLSAVLVVTRSKPKYPWEVKLRLKRSGRY